MWPCSLITVPVKDSDYHKDIKALMNNLEFLTKPLASKLAGTMAQSQHSWNYCLLVDLVPIKYLFLEYNGTWTSWVLWLPCSSKLVFSPDPSSHKPQRPITLLSVLGKSFEQVLLEHILFIKESYNSSWFHSVQFGFRKNYSTDLALLSPKTQLEKDCLFRSATALLKLDRQSLFDRAWHPAILASLIHMLTALLLFATEVGKPWKSALYIDIHSARGSTLLFLMEHFLWLSPLQARISLLRICLLSTIISSILKMQKTRLTKYLKHLSSGLITTFACIICHFSVLLLHMHNIMLDVFVSWNISN